MSYRGILHSKGDDFSDWKGPEPAGVSSIAENALSAGWSCFYLSFIPIAGAFCGIAVIPCAIVAMVMGEKREGIKLLIVSATTIFLVSVLGLFIALTLGSVFAQHAILEATRNIPKFP
ncbi:hypothetical protein TSACC_22382 [Terrimicrobium sacchariphilum]|jgi:hypothetical protein|uniref:Uncharacterized protein n=1 Tax=Terrimicrobium sacchariphilum TaxID=690879 RepID=A0A146G913_TERSA|nr:hypothetical protein [Terrimicrobium sacchariphilum]GAT33961.1 hypothetical protein TSACC_22382 [Terrimicrobium sacchariphilum]